jgi:hypothetical protein
VKRCRLRDSQDQSTAPEGGCDSFVEESIPEYSCFDERVGGIGIDARGSGGVHGEGERWGVDGKGMNLGDGSFVGRDDVKGGR